MRRRIGRRGRSRKRHWLPFRLAFATVCVVVITIASVHIVFAAESDVEIRQNDHISRLKSPIQSLQQSLHVKLKGQDSNSFISSNTNRKLQARTNKKTENNQTKQQREGGRLSSTQLSKLNSLHIHNSVLEQRNGVNKNSSSRGTNNTPRTNTVMKRTSNTTVKGAHLQSNKNAARNSSGGGTSRMKTADMKTAATNANKLLLNNMEQLSGNRGRNRGGSNNNNKNRRRSSRSNNNWNNSGKKNRRSRNNNNRWRASRSGGKFRGNRWGSSGDKWSAGSSGDWASSSGDWASGSGKSGKSGGSSGGSQSWSTSGDDSWSSNTWTTRKKRDSWSGNVQWNLEKQCPCTYIKSPQPVAWGETKQMIKVCTCEPTYMPTTYHPT